MRRGDDAGFALLATLWLVVAITATGVALSLAARERRLAAANRLERTELTAAARGGLAVARARLTWALGHDSAGTADDPWRDPQRWVAETLTIGRARVVVRAEELGTLVPLQVTAEAGFRGFFEAIGADGDKADRLAQVAADWEDGDDLVRGRGAEVAAYQREGGVVRPRNAPMREPRELCDLLGMPAELCAKAIPFTTTEGSGGVDLNAAPLEVLRSLPGVSQEVAVVIVARRARGPAWHSTDEVIRALPATLQHDVTLALPELQRQARFQGEEVRVRVTATMTGSPVQGVVQAVLTRAGDQAIETESRAW